MTTDHTTAATAPRLDALVAARDEDFKPHTWEEVREIIAIDRLDLLGRWPSDARRYADWSNSVRHEYGSVISFICKERLDWTPLPVEERPPDSMFGYESPVPFKSQDDYKILRNDWPYRWDEGIVHICVWLKNKLPTEPETGMITKEGKAAVDKFVDETFVKPLGANGPDHVLWYKNWTALQSVAALEHFHVLLRDIPEWRIHEWAK